MNSGLITDAERIYRKARTDLQAGKITRAQAEEQLRKAMRYVEQGYAVSDRKEADNA